MWRSRAEHFADLVLEAVEHLEYRWSAELEDVEFAVEDVPPPDLAQPEDVDDPVPLTQLLPRRGESPPRIVVFRRPIEARALDSDDLAELVLDVVIHEVAHLLNLSVEVIDPEGHGEEPFD